MTQEQVAAFMRRHVDAWNRRDPDLLCANHAPDGVVLSPMFHKMEGRAQICRTYAELFSAFPDWEMRYEDPFVNEGRVAVFFSVVATHKGDFMGVRGTGRRCSFEGVSLFDLDANLLIAHERRVYDFTGLLVQLGVLRVRVAHPPE